MNRFVRPILALAASIIFFAAQPAAANDGRRHVMTPTQKIDLVRDLPDEPAFERDGDHFDLGYIYPIHTVNGVSVASSGGDAGFVLYHDDKYMKVDASLMADLRFALGDDPTQGYTPPTPASASRSATADPWGANGDSDRARGEPIAARPPVRRSSGMGWVAFVVAFIFLSLVRWGRNVLIRGAFDLIAGGNRRSSSSFADYPHDSTAGEPFDARVSARLSELQGGGGASAPSSYQPPAAPDVRGFGRKGV